MNCEHWEQHIYLYRELNAGEQAAVDRHVATCARCRDLFEAAQQQHALIRKAAAEKPAAQDADATRLTDAIMASVKLARPRHIVMDSAWLRYSMAAASVLLVVTFFLEQPWAQGKREERLVTTPPTVAAHDPVMDSRAFLEATQQRRATPERSRFAQYVSCIQHNDCDNTAVRNFKTKMKL